MPSPTITPAGTPPSLASSTPARPDRRAVELAAFVTLPALASLTLLAWWYIGSLALGMSAMAMPAMHAWTGADALAALVMWSVMMIAMMTPSAAPMIATYDGLRRGARGPAAGTAAFVGGYVVVWLAFSVAAAALQGALHAAGVLAPGAMRVAPLLGAALLIGAGVWQLTPLKDRCLARCRSPLSFLMTEWRDGARGAWSMGLRHGAWCVGCCWALMLVLFAAGIMNLAWVALLAAWVLLEKVAPRGRWIARAGGVMAIGWGCWLLASGL